MSAVRRRYPSKDDVECRPSKWTNMENGIKYLRALAVQEVIYSDGRVTVDPDEMPHKPPMLKKLVHSVPSAYFHTLSTTVWGGSDADKPTVNEVVNKVRRYEDSLSRPFTVAAVEELAVNTEKMT